ncbi:hypothetical protein Tco_0989886 [Tanacetum coccineum]|uniref:Uncharacterized protein n=1 Tax=Tanacetum coccineum TaxID=301880 RepID=A0ABQ5EWB6_9ASTR
MIEKPVLNNKGRVTGQREVRPVWNNAERVNCQNKLTQPHPKRNFVPTAVTTKSEQVPVNAAKQKKLSKRQPTSISTSQERFFISIDGGFIAFAGSPKGGKITGKVTAWNQTNRKEPANQVIMLSSNYSQYILYHYIKIDPIAKDVVCLIDTIKITNEEPAIKGERNGQEKEGGASNKEDDQNVQDFRAELR